LEKTDFGRFPKQSLNALTMIKKLLTISFLLLGISACQTNQLDAPDTEAITEDAGPKVRVIGEAQVLIPGENGDQQRLLADLLYEGLQALDADKLLTPVDDNAHSLFQRVLAYQPTNELALQGLQDIVARYVALSQEASRRGLFEDAQIMLDRARFVDEEHPDINKALLEMQAEMNSGDLFFELDELEFARQTDSAVQKLGTIAEQARQHEAIFLITAPNDDQARWMFSVMREAVEGFRLRGNIELASRHSIRLRLPSEAQP
jgi:hypothetical protein